ncbi:MAG: hypothetical protein V1847_04100 [Candidatus Diapherotrites archaeon]
MPYSIMLLPKRTPKGGLKKSKTRLNLVQQRFDVVQNLGPDHFKFVVHFLGKMRADARSGKQFEKWMDGDPKDSGYGGIPAKNSVSLLNLTLRAQNLSPVKTSELKALYHLFRENKE